LTQQFEKQLSAVVGVWLLSEELHGELMRVSAASLDVVESQQIPARLRNARREPERVC
jgi:hypothetical protein